MGQTKPLFLEENGFANRDKPFSMPSPETLESHGSNVRKRVDSCLEEWKVTTEIRSIMTSTDFITPVVTEKFAFERRNLLT